MQLGPAFPQLANLPEWSSSFHYLAYWKIEIEHIVMQTLTI